MGDLSHAKKTARAVGTGCSVIAIGSTGIKYLRDQIGLSFVANWQGLVLVIEVDTKCSKSYVDSA